MYEYVDKFVVCESKFDHRGKEKKPNFIWKENFDKTKIKYFFLEKPFPKNNDPWKNQAIQREFLLECTNFADKEDYIFFSDPDEIPNLTNFKKIKFQKKYLIFLQNLFYYKLNIKETQLGNNWEGTRGCLKKNLKSIDFMRQKIVKKNLKYGFWRVEKEKSIQIIKMEDGIFLIF